MMRAWRWTVQQVCYGERQLCGQRTSKEGEREQHKDGDENDAPVTSEQRKARSPLAQDVREKVSWGTVTQCQRVETTTAATATNVIMCLSPIKTM